MPTTKDWGDPNDHEFQPFGHVCEDEPDVDLMTDEEFHAWHQSIGLEEVIDGDSCAICEPTVSNKLYQR